MDSPEIKKQIGVKLRALRKKAGFGSYVDFAFYYDLPKNSVLRAETGKVTFDNLMPILNAHGISPEKFFKGIK